MNIGILLIIGLLVGGWLLFQNINENNIQNTPASMISSLPSKGHVKIIGTAGENTISSPTTRTACVFWKIEVQEIGGRYWATTLEEVSEESFDVHDGTGTIQVLPDPSCELKLKRENMQSNTSHDFSPQMLGVLHQLGIETTGVLGLNKDLQVIEKFVRSGEQIHVWGDIKDENGIKKIIARRITIPSLG